MFPYILQMTDSVYLQLQLLVIPEQEDEEPEASKDDASKADHNKELKEKTPDLNELDTADGQYMKNVITELLNRPPDPNNVYFDIENLQPKL